MDPAEELDKDVVLCVVTEKPDALAQASFFRECGRPLWVGVNILAPFCFLPALSPFTVQRQPSQMAGVPANNQSCCSSLCVLCNYRSYQGFP